MHDDRSREDRFLDWLVPDRFVAWMDRGLDRLITDNTLDKIDWVLSGGREGALRQPKEASLDKAHDLLRSSHGDRPVQRGGLGSTKARQTAGREPHTPER